MINTSQSQSQTQKSALTGFIYLKDKAYIINKTNPSLSLGEGGFGKVYKGFTTEGNKPVAIKQINLDIL